MASRPKAQAAPSLLTARWTPLRPHALQQAYFNSPHQYNVLPCGRRSGKTELAKRKLVIKTLKGSRFPRPRFVAAAPTRDQAKSIYWNDLKAMVPAAFIADISESNLFIELITGATLNVVGMDKPQRIEGTPLDGIVLDEYADMKATAWTENVLPALADRDGWADLIGVPEGRNHYFDTYEAALARMLAEGDASPWGAFTWKSREILSAAKIAEFERNMDPRSFRQEFEASFEAYGGLVIYAFNRHRNMRECPVDWRQLPLHIGQDFNLKPMTSTVWVEHGGIDYQVDEIVLDTSNTDELVRELHRKFPNATGRITIYPDASGSSEHTSSGGRTDHSILRAGGFKVVAPSKNPPVRDRLNLTNARFCAADGTVRAYVSARCVQTIAALEKHSYVKGTNEPNKKDGFDHYVDSCGYQFWMRHAVKQTTVSRVNLMGR